MGKLSGARFAAPNLFRTTNGLARRDSTTNSMQRRNASSRSNGTTNWYWMNPRGPYSRFQEPMESRVMKVSGDRLDLPVFTAGLLAQPQLVEHA